MSWFPSMLLRPHPGALIVLGSSALGGAAYRYGSSASSPDASLNPHSFTAYTLIRKEKVSSTSAIFTLRNRERGPDPDEVRDGWRRRVWSVQVKQPELQIARAYTPLPSLGMETGGSIPASSIGGEGEDAEDAAPEDLRLLIRKENGGEVSTYLHTLPEQSTIHLRGPNTECELPTEVKTVIFLAGGTGIAPAMQVAGVLAQRKGSRMRILWANRRREECAGGVGDEERDRGGRGVFGPGLRDNGKGNGGERWWKRLFWSEGDSRRDAVPESDIQIHTQTRIHADTGVHPKNVIVRELEALQHHTKLHSPTNSLSISYFVDEENQLIKPGDVARRLDIESRGTEGKGDKVILVSGPDGFIEYWAGKKLWVGGREVQGPLGGVLGQMDLRGWRVFKL
ncbi:hypothetical protein BCR34DRAFT_572434 [Clohesyomyces aquaticus]|uniref:FAD-binding FR-type domain-containing protein n=1 Tax=Clohesyomyces aquaticus TaxID=1231657 RepID=A0A1Y1Z3Q9_9PLEO|nr:hypothetical protein BCR34DRAFT_572434 [Clohesyomyces aquaticus]